MFKKKKKKEKNVSTISTLACVSAISLAASAHIPKFFNWLTAKHCHFLHMFLLRRFKMFPSHGSSPFLSLQNQETADQKHPASPAVGGQFLLYMLTPLLLCQLPLQCAHQSFFMFDIILVCSSTSFPSFAWSPEQISGLAPSSTSLFIYFLRYLNFFTYRKCRKFSLRGRPLVYGEVDQSFEMLSVKVQNGYIL